MGSPSWGLILSQSEANNGLGTSAADSLAGERMRGVSAGRLSGWTSASVLCVAVGLLSAAHADEPLNIHLEAKFTADDNVTRAQRSGDKLSDRSLGFSAAMNHVLPVSGQTRLVVVGKLGGERFDTYSGLSRTFVGIEGEYQYRASAAYDAPTFGLFGRGYRDFYESDLRDGYRYTAGVRALRSLTDRVDLYAELTYNRRDGSSEVFDGHDYAGLVNFDVSLSQKGTLYLNGQYRRGDVVSTARPALEYVDIAKAIVQDDVFTDTQRFAYRIEARTVIATVGYNVALAERQSLDFSWRWVRSSATSDPGFVGASPVRYIVNQLTLAYLLHF